MRKMHQHIINAIFQSGGVVYGGYVRDTILGTMPHDVDCKVSGAHCADEIVHYLQNDKSEMEFVLHQILCGSHSLDNYAFSRIIVSTTEMPDIDVQIDVSMTAGHATNIDFDVNTLIMTTENKIIINNGNHISPIVGLDMIKLIQKINAQEFSILCKNQDASYTTDHQCTDFVSPAGHKIMERIQKMEKRGWTLTGHTTCKNPRCILAPKEAQAQFVEKLRLLHNAYTQLMIDDVEVAESTSLGSDFLSLDCISLVRNWK